MRYVLQNRLRYGCPLLSDLTVRSAFAPIFEQYGVQLSISGHEHDYERTVPIPTGTTGSKVVYVVTGGGGGPLYANGTSSWTAYSASRYEYIKVTITGCTLTLKAIGSDGTTIAGC